MNKINCIILFLLIAISSAAKTSVSYEDISLVFTQPTEESRSQADSIMRYVMENASLYADAISRYKADVYIKGETEIIKSNRLILFAHHLFPVDRHKKNIIFEIMSESEYDAPNIYKHNLKAIHGNTIPNEKKQQEILSFLNFNIYSPTVYDESILTPVGEKATRFYTFNLEAIEEVGESRIFKIRFLPKQVSQRLLSGDLYIKEDEWRIEKIHVVGRVDFAAFDMHMELGHAYGQLILPNKVDLHLCYNVLGNRVESTYHSSFHYKEVEWTEKKEKVKGAKREWKPLDLTHYYSLSTDPVLHTQDTAFWNRTRDIPLTEKEKRIYEIHYPTRKKGEKDTTETIDYLKLTEQLTSNINYTSPSTRIRYSGILNPLQLGYSSRNGITYKQRLRITKTFKNEKQLTIKPEIGFVFKRKEIFYKLQTEWNYKPEKKGTVQLLLANDNQTYSSRMMQDINAHLQDSSFNFDALNLKYYKHHYVDLHNCIEISNGLQFGSSVAFHRRSPVKPQTQVDPGEEIEDLITETFYDFTPAIYFTYTPRQFYRMNGKRKEYVYSYYPTISIEIAQGIPNILQSSGNYGRVEGDIHQSLNLGLTQRFNYHLSGGFYTRKKSLYFAEFRYFARRNFPESWDERIGGVFHTLKREWFNASDKYVQAHLMYESPFILMQLLNKNASRYVLSERCYLGQLWTPALPCYTEVGYGLGNQVFNIALFAGFNKGKYDNIGLRFTFEIE
ncbi:hypothetical protein D0T51_02090 [Parabacteroides sp. 52]|uniref:DUF5686 family protein n=1 Tax=Parabacteroides sp. 52 TaxID=2302940 RepID=UPI0013D5728A|nr:DUF5686 family protein [Parabacteroides sp. 52]NDV54527.1 hypothetical protein [Parabacteroides sp. 52]